jgi:transposase
VPGEELPQERASGHIPEALIPALGPILEQIGPLTERIRDYYRKLETISKEHYPHQTEHLCQVEGVGALTALIFVMTVEDAGRFTMTRTVGAYDLGLVPATDQSGDRDPQKRISKEGDQMLRQHLVGSAHCILGSFGSDSDPRRYGEKIAPRGGKGTFCEGRLSTPASLGPLLPRLPSGPRSSRR